MKPERSLQTMQGLPAHYLLVYSCTARGLANGACTNYSAETTMYSTVLKTWRHFNRMMATHCSGHVAHHSQSVLSVLHSLTLESTFNFRIFNSKLNGIIVMGTVTSGEWTDATAILIVRGNNW
jgi:hypothetical protein